MILSENSDYSELVENYLFAISWHYLDLDVSLNSSFVSIEWILLVGSIFDILNSKKESMSLVFIESLFGISNYSPKAIIQISQRRLVRELFIK